MKFGGVAPLEGEVAIRKPLDHPPLQVRLPNEHKSQNPNLPADWGRVGDLPGDVILSRGFVEVRNHAEFPPAT